MSKQVAKRSKSKKVSALDGLRKRGMAIEAFAEGYAAREAIIRAGRMVHKMRTDAGLTQTELAKLAGMSQPEISRLESGLGKQGPGVETLDRLAKACHLRLVMGLQDFAAPASAELKYVAEI